MENAHDSLWRGISVEGAHMPAYDVEASKKPANLTINSDLLRHARMLKINLSAVLEKALVDELRRRQAQQWLHENQAAIAAYNAVVEAQGVYSDGIRTF